MSFSFVDLSAALKNGGQIKPQDVLGARRLTWGDGGVSAAEADAIFELNRLATNPPGEWVDFFVEALTEFVVNQQPPHGYVDDANAAWLMGKIDQDGRVETLGELELLVKVMDAAVNVPAVLKSYAIRQIEQVVVNGEGPTRRGGEVRPGVIDETEVTLLRRLVFAGASDGGLTVNREEAEALFRIKDACKDTPASPAWQKLFVQAIGNHVLANQLYQPLEREDAQRLEAFMNDHSSSIAGFLGRMGRSLTSGGFRTGLANLSSEASLSSEERAPAVVPEQVSPQETTWLNRHLDADATLDPLEKALVAFLAAESGNRPAGM